MKFLTLLSPALPFHSPEHSACSYIPHFDVVPEEQTNPQCIEYSPLAIVLLFSSSTPIPTLPCAENLQQMTFFFILHH